MSTIEITAIDDLREGDYVTLRWEKSEGGTVTLEGSMQFRATVGGHVITDARFVSATREVPEWEPGTAGTATVAVDAEVMTSGWLPGIHLFRVDAGWRDVDDRFYTDGQVRDFVPDDAEALRRSLEAAREGYRKEAADWRARDTRMGAEIERLEAAVERLRREALKYKEAARKYLSEREKECAEVERWKAEAEMLTAKVDRLMPLQEHENECAYRQRTEKAEAEVERLESEVKRLRDSMDANTNVLISSNGTIWHHDTHCPHRRTAPTRKQIVDAMWPGAPESARAGMTHLDIVDRILALYGQGDES